MAHGTFCSYLRVSTAKQGASGLGIEAQRQAIADYLNGGRWSLIAEFVEIESGKRENRPQLHAALRHCKATGSTLVIARLDRLARNAHFLLGLQNAGVKFVAVDMPDANEMTVGIMAVIAQGEAKAISNRTKAALAAAKARGVLLGGCRYEGQGLSAEAAKVGRELGAAAKRAKAEQLAADLLPIIRNIQEGGTTSLHGIAAELNRRGILTARRQVGKWTAQGVKNLLARA
jgi:DNA invertase Pin-like site-specific DNA recombinase